jgi:hypothetical protein
MRFLVSMGDALSSKKIVRTIEENPKDISPARKLLWRASWLCSFSQGGQFQSN